MPRKRHTAEEIIGKLREVEIRIGQGVSAVEAIRGIGVTEQTYYRWRKEYGGQCGLRLAAVFALVLPAGSRALESSCVVGRSDHSRLLRRRRHQPGCALS